LSRKIRAGKSAAKQVPFDKDKNKNTDDIFGFMAGKGKITVTSSLYPSERRLRPRQK
jgi:hypothetical protein